MKVGYYKTIEEAIKKTSQEYISFEDNILAFKMTTASWLEPNGIVLEDLISFLVNVSLEIQEETTSRGLQESVLFNSMEQVVLKLKEALLWYKERNRYCREMHELNSQYEKNFALDKK